MEDLQANENAEPDSKCSEAVKLHVAIPLQSLYSPWLPHKYLGSDELRRKTVYINAMIPRRLVAWSYLTPLS